MATELLSVSGLSNVHLHWNSNKTDPKKKLGIKTLGSPFQHKITLELVYFLPQQMWEVAQLSFSAIAVWVKHFWAVQWSDFRDLKFSSMPLPMSCINSALRYRPATRSFRLVLTSEATTKQECLGFGFRSNGDIIRNMNNSISKHRSGNYKILSYARHGKHNKDLRNCLLC